MYIQRCKENVLFFNKFQWNIIPYASSNFSCDFLGMQVWATFNTQYPDDIPQEDWQEVDPDAIPTEPLHTDISIICKGTNDCLNRNINRDSLLKTYLCNLT